MKNRLITAWKSAKGRTVIISGGSAIAGIVLVAIIFVNIGATSTVVGRKFTIGNSASSTSSAASASATSSSIPVVSAAPAPSNAAPTAASALHTVPVTSVDFNHRSLSLKVGATAQLTANITPDTATDKSLAWTSTNTNVVTVDGSGVITAKNAGTASVRATNPDGQRDTCTVTVTGDAGNAGGGSNNTGNTGAGGASNGGGSGNTGSNNNGGGTPAAQYVRVDATHTYTDEITGIAQTVHFQGVGFSNEIAGGYADINTTPEMGMEHKGPATFSVIGPAQQSTPNVVAGDGQNGGAVFSNLTAGTYTFQLTAGDGAVVARYHFTVDAHGNIQ
ncbi:Ig-like domain-containing protein [Ethanoligenens sp.]|uniref:Ig-like domain-containing protein n=1 Tax=Ethanoligenens sp. TaxID=2099655 RepID=UPI0039E889FA